VLTPAPRAVLWLRRTRAQLAEQTRALTPSPKAAAFYLTLAAGLRAEMGSEWERIFSRSGLAHLLSVSGLHVAALAWMVLGLLRRLAVHLMAACSGGGCTPHCSPLGASVDLVLRRLHQGTRLPQCVPQRWPAPYLPASPSDAAPMR
jgi:hypothetical protein